MKIAIQLIFVVASLFLSTVGAKTLGDPTCRVDGNVMTIDFGTSKAPTYAGVETPGGLFIYLRYAPEAIDVLGPSYGGRVSTLEIDSLTGYVLLDGEKNKSKVFVSDGEYRFVFEDANTAYGVNKHRLSCTVSVSKNQLIDVSARLLNKNVGDACANSANTSSSSLAWNGDASIIHVGCNSVGSCGGGMRCCKKSAPNEPCYCSNCCIARPPFTMPVATILSEQ